ALMLAFTLLNLLSVRSWGESEYWFASIKVAAIVLFLCVGLAFISHAWPGVHGGIANLTAHGGFMPHGIGPVLTGAVAATGFYFCGGLGAGGRGGGGGSRGGRGARHAIGDFPRAHLLRGLDFRGRGDTAVGQSGDAATLCQFAA